MVRTEFHVVPDGRAWLVKRNGKPAGSYGIKVLAVEAARGRARGEQPAQVIVHGESGRIQEEFIYGDDPSPPRG